MRVGIVCFNQNHYEYVVSLCTWFAEASETVFVLTNPRLAESVGPLVGELPVQVIACGLGASESAFIFSHTALLDSLDQVIFDEFFDLKDSWRLLGLKLHRERVWLTVHSANIWFFPNRFGSLSGLVKTTIRTLLRHKFSQFVVFLDAIKTHIESSSNGKDRVIILPFSLPEPSTDRPRRVEKIRLVTPGIVETSRRNYDRILNVITRFHPTECPIELTLLGRAKDSEGDRVLKRCAELAKLGYGITTFDRFVPADDFARIMHESEFIFSDIPAELVRDNTVEIYGKTKDTGVTYLMTKYGLPAILPSHFATATELMPAVLPFSDEESLYQLVRELTQDQTPELRRRVLQGSEQYIDRLHETFQSNFGQTGRVLSDG